MLDIDLSAMSMEDLKALKKDVEKAIDTYEARKLGEARAILEEKARELGVTLNAVMAIASGNKKSVAAKYRHPENASLTWTGRGRAPTWITTHEAQGGNRTDFLIE